MTLAGLRLAVFLAPAVFLSLILCLVGRLANPDLLLPFPKLHLLLIQGSFFERATNN